MERETSRLCADKRFINSSISAVSYHKMQKKGIKGQSLSHNQAMENKQENKQELTKGVVLPNEHKDGVVISTKEAAEYCEFKKQRKRADIRNAIVKSEGVLTNNGEVKKILERAVKHRQAAVRMTPAMLEYVRPWVVTSGVKVDCLIGGNGDTLSKVKVYEAKCALKMKARELTVTISPSMLADCRFAGIRKELKRLRRVAGKSVLKARIEKRCSPERLASMEKICSDVGVDYLSIPYYDGCERAKMGLVGNCRLEVFGVDSLPVYQRLVASGVARIVTERVEEIQAEWLKEVEQITFPKLLAQARREEEKTQPPAVVDALKNTCENVIKTEQPKEESKRTEGITAKEPMAKKEEVKEEKKTDERTLREKENDYQCRLEGKELKFL